MPGQTAAERPPDTRPAPWLYAAVGFFVLAFLIVLALYLQARQTIRRLERDAQGLHHEMAAQRAEATARINKLERALREAVREPEAVRQRLDDLLPPTPYTTSASQQEDPDS